MASVKITHGIIMKILEWSLIRRKSFRASKRPTLKLRITIIAFECVCQQWNWTIQLLRWKIPTKDCKRKGFSRPEDIASGGIDAIWRSNGLFSRNFLASQRNAIVNKLENAWTLCSSGGMRISSRVSFYSRFDVCFRLHPSSGASRTISSHRLSSNPFTCGVLVPFRMTLIGENVLACLCHAEMVLCCWNEQWNWMELNGIELKIQTKMSGKTC